MSALAPSPVRTAEKPLAFTGEELIRGGITAWLVFMVLLICGETVHLTTLRFRGERAPAALEAFVAAVPALVIYLLCAGIVAAFVTPIGILIVMLIARAMRGLRAMSIHLAVYSAFSVGIGGACIAIAPAENPVAWFFVIPAGSFAIAIPLAWWWTARRALRIDAGLFTPRPRHPDLDAAYEDRLTAADHAEAPRES